MFCILLANLRKWIKTPYNLLDVNEHFESEHNAKITLLDSFLHLIKLLPALTWWITNKQCIGEWIIDDNLLLAVEYNLLVKTLRDNAQTECLAQRTKHLEWRTSLLLAHTSQEEVLVVV